MSMIVYPYVTFGMQLQILNPMQGQMGLEPILAHISWEVGPWIGLQFIMGLTHTHTDKHIHTHTYQQITVANSPNLHVFGQQQWAVAAIRCFPY